MGGAGIGSAVFFCIVLVVVAPGQPSSYLLDSNNYCRQMPGSTLSASGIGPLEYHRTVYDRDLQRVTAGTNDRHFRLSVASFCPDWPDVPIYAEPARAFHSLGDSLWFLCSFFVTQLVDQASHSSLGFVSKRRAESQGQIVLVGLLGSYWNVMTPAFLLLVMSLYGRPVEDDIVVRGLELVLRSELADCPSRPESRAAVLATASAALQPWAVPNSLRAFVPHGDGYRLQPDLAFVEHLRQRVAQVLVEAAV